MEYEYVDKKPKNMEDEVNIEMVMFKTRDRVDQTFKYKWEKVEIEGETKYRRPLSLMEKVGYCLGLEEWNGKSS